MSKLRMEQRHGICVPEAAELLGVSKSMLYQWTHIKGFPCMRLGNRIIVSRERLLTWFDEQITKGGIAQ